MPLINPLPENNRQESAHFPLFCRGLLLVSVGLISACAAKPHLQTTHNFSLIEIQGFVGTCNTHTNTHRCQNNPDTDPNQAFQQAAAVPYGTHTKGFETSNPANPFPRVRTEEVVKIGPIEKVTSIADIPLIAASATSQALADLVVWSPNASVFTQRSLVTRHEPGPINTESNLFLPAGLAALQSSIPFISTFSGSDLNIGNMTALPR